MATVIHAEGSGSNKLGLTSPTHVSGAGMSRITLPKLNMVEFNGYLKAWQIFYDIFEGSTHNYIEISNVEKFMYLRSCLKGEPLSLVSSLPLAGANYSVAWDSLISRHNQPSLLMNAYLEALLGLRPVERNMNNYEQYTGALSALGNRVEDWSVILLFLLRKKLSSDLRQGWEKEVSEEGLMTVKCFISFLEKEASVLETAKFGPSKGVCRVGIQSKRAKQNSCQHCPFKHHSLLHFTPRDQDSRKATEVEKVEGQVNTESDSVVIGNADGGAVTLTTPVESVTDSSQDLAEGSKCAVLLSTAVARVRDQYGNYQRVKILIDSASQGSFITKACAQRLGLPIKRAITSIFGLAQTAVGVAHGKLTVVFKPTPKGGPIE
ncbi:hypothetical protein J437_LFUL017841, partial [Ladona fulva]